MVDTYSHGQELFYKFVRKITNKLVKQLLSMTVCTHFSCRLPSQSNLIEDYDAASYRQCKILRNFKLPILDVDVFLVTSFLDSGTSNYIVLLRCPTSYIPSFKFSMTNFISISSKVFGTTCFLKSFVKNVLCISTYVCLEYIYNSLMCNSFHKH